MSNEDLEAHLEKIVKIYSDKMKIRIHELLESSMEAMVKTNISESFAYSDLEVRRLHSRINVLVGGLIVTLLIALGLGGLLTHSLLDARVSQQTLEKPADDTAKSSQPIGQAAPPQSTSQAAAKPHK